MLCAAGGFSSAKTFYQGLSSNLGKGAFIVGSTGTGTGLFVMNGFAANWDFSKPGVYYGFVDAITGAPDLPMFMRSAGKSFAKHGGQMLKGIRGGQSKLAFLAAGKMGLKVVGMGAGVSSYVLLSMLDKGRLNADNFDISTVLAGTLTTNQFYSIGRNAYRVRKLPKKKEMVERAKGISKQVAEETVAEYKKIIENNKGGVPNTAISVAMTDNVAVAGFSTNSASGLVALYTRNEMGNFIYGSHQFLDSNRVIGGRKVTLSDNAELNNRIMERINDVQEKIKEDNRREFQEQITNGDLSRSLDTILNGVLNDVKSSIIRDLNEAMNKDGEVKRSVMDDIMKKYLVEQDPEKQTRMISIHIMDDFNGFASVILVIFAPFFL